MNTTQGWLHLPRNLRIILFSVACYLLLFLQSEAKSIEKLHVREMYTDRDNSLKLKL